MGVRWENVRAIFGSEALRRLVFCCLFAAVVVLTCPIVSSAECLTTLPPYPAFVPPAPFFTTSTDVWYGTDSLWTQLWVNSTWHLENNVGKGKFYRAKLGFGRKEYDRLTVPLPKLIVAAKKLDSEAPLVFGKHASVWSVGNNTLAMTALIDIPTIGCWEITGQYRGQAVSFVVSVEP
jgi:hypothetical protein